MGKGERLGASLDVPQLDRLHIAPDGQMSPDRVPCKKRRLKAAQGKFRLKVAGVDRNHLHLVHSANRESSRCRMENEFGLGNSLADWP